MQVVKHPILNYLGLPSKTGVEMEAAGIYGVAAEYGARALTICTVSDHIRTHEQTSAEERQLTFNEMIKVALETVLIDDKAN